jgi:diacylglycerol kinase (ATP)
MTRTRFAAVVNPAAGNGTAAAIALRLARELRELGADVHVAYSRSLTHATELAAAAVTATETVLAIGGDGLTGAVAAALAGTTTELAVIPAGRGNDLARALPPLTATSVRTLPSHPIDVASANGRVVVGSVYAGLDAAANEAANRWHLPRRPIAYQLAAAGVLAGWRPVRYDLIIDGARLRLRAHTVVVANGPWYGGALKIAPSAGLTDGLLDLITIGAMPRHRLPAILAAMRRGTHVGRPGIECRQVREVTISTDRPTPIYADGEPLPPPPTTITIRPAALHLIGAATAAPSANRES